MKAPADEPPTTPPRAFAIFASIRTAGQLNELGEHFGALLATTGHHHRTRARSDRRRAIPGGGSRATADLTSCCAAGPGIAGDDQREQHDRRRLRETQDERWSGHRRRREKGERRGGASNCSVRSEGQPCCAITPSCLQACTPARLHALAPPLPLDGPPRAVRPDLGETCFGAGATPVAPSAPSARPPGFPMTETLSRFVKPLAVGAAEN